MLSLSVRAGIGSPEAKVFTNCIVQAGPGDYVEIGTAYGGSAILAALVKKFYQIPGDIYCIDNFKGKGKLLYEITPAKVMENAYMHDVHDRIHICKADSHPWPLGEQKFVAGLVDGHHFGSMPARDFINMSKRVTKYIMLDDVAMRYPNIMRLCSAIEHQGKWKCCDISGKIVMFENKSYGTE